MLKLLSLPAEQDPMPLSRHLWKAKLGHRILPDEQGNHVFWLLDVGQLPLVQQALDDWQAGRSTVPATNNPNALIFRIKKVPVTVLVLLLACLITAAFEWVFGAIVFLLISFTPMEFVDNQLVSLPLSTTLSSGQWWRLITPIFLHFGIMHLVFNALWIWILGEMIERNQGQVKLVLLILFTALISNSAQFLINDSSQFGGLSGVVYGYLGYIWLWSKLHPQQGLAINNGLVIFMLGWMLLGITDFSRSLLGLNMANEAHLGGLLAGLAFALLPWFKKKASKKTSI